MTDAAPLDPKTLRVMRIEMQANHVPEEFPLDKVETAVDYEFVRERTGYAIGGVPPVGHIEAIRTFVDEDLLRFDRIWAAAGTPNAVFELSPAELPRLTGGAVVRIT